MTTVHETTVHETTVHETTVYEAEMTARLPETLDGVVLTTADEAESLLASLRHLESVVSERLGRRSEHAYGHSGDDVPRQVDTEAFAGHVASAIESVEAARGSLEAAKQLRSRCQDQDNCQDQLK